MRCKSCGNKDNDSNANNCINCGKSLRHAETGRTISLNRPQHSDHTGSGLITYALVLALIGILVIGLMNIFKPTFSFLTGNTIGQEFNIAPAEAAKQYRIKLEKLANEHAVLAVVFVPESTCKVAFDDNLELTFLPNYGRTGIVQTVPDDPKRMNVKVNVFCGKSY